MRLFDPAWGCGNFLIIAYRELRTLEMELIQELGEFQFSRIDVDQFYGIEIGGFPARIAETALWMMDHIMNNRLTLQLGQSFARIPLTTSPHIVHGDALETDWAELLAPDECSFVFGNPPFVGAKNQTVEQRAQVRRIAALGDSGGTLDYVSAWYIKAGAYVARGNARVGFVATNSITQGEQAAQLWPILFDRLKLEISFAHRTFAWGSDARGKAHVHVVIVGLDARERARSDKRLFSYPDINGEPEESLHPALSPYLFDSGGLADSHLTVRKERSPINGMRSLKFGTQPLENGNLTFSTAQKTEFVGFEPPSESYFRPFVGAREFLHDEERWILHLADIPPQELRDLPMIRKRLQAVRKFRAQSKRKATERLAEYPTGYGVTVVPENPFLVIPRVSSERREFVPFGWLNPPIIPSEATLLLLDATLTDFALLTSSMHMAWMRHIGGRLKSDYRYSIGLVYNTFPMPPEGADLQIVEPLAKTVLDARATHPGATLADLYNPDLMPTNVRRAHQALDRAVDRLYRRARFGSERERIEHLFMRYENMRGALYAQIGRKRKRRKTTTRASRGDER